MARTANEGGCMCGAIRFVADGEPLRTGICHCTICRRNTGAPFAVFAIFSPDQLRLQGETAIYRSSQKGQRHFCRDCGTPLFYVEEGERAVHLGAFDEPETVRPTYEIWSRSRVDWLPVMADVKRYPEDKASSGRSPDSHPAKA